MTQRFIHLPGQTTVGKNADLLYDDLASVLMVRGTEAVQNRRVFHLALSGGSTPEPFYMRLVMDPRYRAMPWDKVHVWLVDERRVDEHDERSNWKMVCETLLDHVPIPARQLHPIPALHPDPVGRYEAQLRLVFQMSDCATQPPRFDMILLGMGEDCHTASLFPRSAALQVYDHWLTVNTGEYVTPPERVTMTYPLINAARHIGVLVVGAAKNIALQRVSDQMRRGPDPTRLPITGVAPMAGGAADMGWYLDPAAAGMNPENV